MIVTWQQLGRFGNNMFQYALAHIVAEKYKCKVKTDTNFSEGETHFSGFYDEFFYLDEKHNIGIENFSYVYDDTIKNFLLTNDTYIKNIRLEGYFQDNELYKRKNLKKYFKVNENKIKKYHNDDICLSLRLGSDYESLGWVIPSNIFVNVLRNISYRKLFIVTDYYNESYLKEFKEFHPEVICNNSSTPIDDFYNLMSFKNLIIGNSTFSYWAAVLGNSNKIYTTKNWDWCNLSYILGKKSKTFFYER